MPASSMAPELVVGEHPGGDVARERDGREAREDCRRARARSARWRAGNDRRPFLPTANSSIVEAVAADFALRRFGRAEQIRVVAAGQPAIRRDHHQQRAFLRALDRRRPRFLPT